MQLVEHDQYLSMKDKAKNRHLLIQICFLKKMIVFNNMHISRTIESDLTSTAYFRFIVINIR